MSKKLFTIKEACLALSIKESRMRSAIFNKEISYRKIGRLIRFTEEDLTEFINKNIVGACDE